MPVHICQTSGCFSAKPPKWQVIINIVTDESFEVLAEGRLAAVVCDDCKKNVELKNLLDTHDWDKIIAELTECLSTIQKPCYDRSFLSFKALPGPRIH